MKRFLTLTAACCLLSLPAMAQSSSGSQSNSGTSQSSSSMSQNTSGGNGQSGQQVQTINPSNLSQSEVKQVQVALNKAGFAAHNVDGLWGEDTITALANYQQRNNLPGNGTLNRQTLQALGVNVNIASGNGQSGNNQSGNGQQVGNIAPSDLSTSQIKQIQVGLNKAGFSAHSVDGIWGDETASALQNYQQRNNLSGNGQINQQTLQALGVNLNGQSQGGNSGTSGAQSGSGTSNQ